MKKILKKYFVILYASYYFWSSPGKAYNITKDTVVGHIVGLIISVFLIIISFLHRINLIKFALNLKEYRILILSILGFVIFLFIIIPIDKYIKKNITIEEVENELKKNKFTKSNTFKYFLWSIFALVFWVLFLFLFIKFILYPIVDFFF